MSRTLTDGFIYLIALSIVISSICFAPARAVELKAIYVSDIKMRDGVKLAADIYLPVEPGRYPALLIRTPYDPNIKPPLDFPKRLAEAGYAVVLNHCRGRYDSGGKFIPFKNEGRDGYDTVEWIVKQPWCDGQVGLIGSSYSGIACWQLAALDNPHVKAMFAMVAPADLYRDIVFPGGAFALSTSVWWFSIVDRRTVQYWRFNNWDEALKHLPVLTIDEQLGRRFNVLRDQMAHPAYGKYWKDFYSMDGLYDRVHIPVFAVGGFNDPLVVGVLDTYMGLRNARKGDNDCDARVQALIGPWDHFGGIIGTVTTFGDFDYGKEAAVDIAALASTWFDKWLKSKEPPAWQKQPLKYFVSGPNQWREDVQWPPQSVADETFYLESTAAANTANGGGHLTKSHAAGKPSDEFTYDPTNPVPSLVSKHVLLNSAVKDIAKIESRPDLLVYTSDALKEDLAVAGNPRLVLYVSTDAPDTDFAAWLTEVYPDGRSMSIYDGVVRCARFVEPAAQRPVLKGGQVYKVEISLGSVSHVFKAGNKLRLDISSSNFPAFDRNLNAGGDNWLGREARVAHQVVRHESGAESQLVLPVAH